jgi:hypothetical protein
MICPYCNGIGEIYRRSGAVVCSKCNGEGMRCDAAECHAIADIELECGEFCSDHAPCCRALCDGGTCADHAKEPICRDNDDDETDE